MSLQNTPRANRLHIGLYGQRNSGKSSLLNALTGQQFALVSDVAGTTTDPVYKSMELHGVGPVVWIDTAGFDDDGQLCALRVQKTEEALSENEGIWAVYYYAHVFQPDENYYVEIDGEKIYPLKEGSLFE